MHNFGHTFDNFLTTRNSMMSKTFRTEYLDSKLKKMKPWMKKITNHDVIENEDLYDMKVILVVFRCWCLWFFRLWGRVSWILSWTISIIMRSYSYQKKTRKNSKRRQKRKNVIFLISFNFSNPLTTYFTLVNDIYKSKFLEKNYSIKRLAQRVSTRFPNISIKWPTTFNVQFKI